MIRYVPEDLAPESAAIPRIALNRRDAATALGVSIDTLKQAQAAGKLKAKNTHIDPRTGRANGTTLYDVDELRRWFNSLDDA